MYHSKILLRLVVFTLFASSWQFANATTTPDCNCDGNVLKNGDFESVTNNKPNDWTFIAANNPPKDQIPTFTSDGAYNVCPNDSRNGLMHYKGVFYQDAPIAPGFTATLNIWGGYHSLSEHKFKLIFLDKDKKEVGTTITANLNHSVDENPQLWTGPHGMTKYTLAGVAPETAKFVRVQGSASNDYFKVDQACLVLTPPSPGCQDCTANKLANPSFETTEVKNGKTVPTNWVGSSRFISDNGYKVCGNKNGLISDGAGSFYQDVKISPTNIATLKVWGGYHELANQKFELQFFSKTGANPISTETALLDMSVESLSNHLKMYTLVATAPANTEYVRIIGSSTGNFFKVDFACLTIKENSLPVTLIDFKVAREGNNAVLSWNTAAETNSREFDVQQSTDAKNWLSLSKIASSGESSTLQSYSYTHTNPAGGNNQYRLKMIDRDDTFAFSRIVNLNFESEEIVIFPNPVSNRVKFNMNGVKITNVQIFSANGTMVMDAIPDSLNELDLTKVSQGNYIMKVKKADGALVSRRIQVTR